MDQFLMLCHPVNEIFVRDNKRAFLREVFDYKKSKCGFLVLSDSSFSPDEVHTFLNGLYLGFVTVVDDDVKKPRDESKLPTGIN